MLKNKVYQHKKIFPLAVGLRKYFFIPYPRKLITQLYLG
jgi:hypothetical protein